MIVWRKLIENKRFQPIRFAVIGGIATLIHITVAAILLSIFSLMNVYIINIGAFSIAFFFSFLGHKYITFQSSGSIVKFFSVSVLGFLVNNAILTLGLFFSLSNFYAILFATVCVPLFTYIISKKWIFKG